MGQKTFGDKIFDFCNAGFMILLMLVFTIPFWVVLASSVIGPIEAAARGPYQLFTTKPDFTCYRVLLDEGSVMFSGYFITISRTIVGVIVNLLLTVTLAYGLAKRNLPYRRAITLFVFFPMLFGGGLVPTYLLINNLGLLDTFWAMILPGAVNVWNTILMRNFIMQIPESLEESAKIDGAGHMRILFSIILPLSTASIATIGLFYAVAHWNSWFDAAMYINSRELVPLQLLLRNVVVSLSANEFNTAAMYESTTPPTTEGMKCAAIIVTTIPIICVYPFLQKYFVKGVLVGSVKG